MKIKLNPMESKILLAMQADPKRVWNLDEIGQLLYGPAPIDKRKRSGRPDKWRVVISIRMRMLILKTLSTDQPIERISRLGRGNKAAYRLGSVSNKNETFLSHPEGRR